MDQNITDEQRTVVERVEKLLRLAGKNTNENEAAAATAKAMELLAAYNLDMAVVGREGAEAGGKRTDENLRGGFYQFERDLWSAVADLNFCLYWTQTVWEKRTKIDARSEALVSRWSREHVMRHQHRLVGRAHNVRATQALAEYLLSATERLTREFLAGYDESNMRSRRATSYREGIVERVVEKVYARRQEQLRGEARKRREAASAAAAAGMAAASTATAVTLADLRQTERDANLDHLYGEGWSAKRRAERAAQAEAERQAEEEYTRWAAAHPDEAAKMEAEREKEAARAARRGPGSRGGGGSTKERDWGAYKAGYATGAAVGIDPQAGNAGAGAASLAHTRRLGHE